MKVTVKIPDIKIKNGIKYSPTGDFRNPNPGEFYLNSKFKLNKYVFNAGKRFIYTKREL